MPNSIKKMLGYKIQNLSRFENIFMLDVTSECKCNFRMQIIELKNIGARFQV